MRMAAGGAAAARPTMTGGGAGAFFCFFFGRAFGACMTGMAALNFLEGADKATMLKAMAIGGACMLPQMVSNANDDVNFMTVIWKAQIVMHIATTYVLAKAGGLL